jgi:ABC-type methionine transport system ATPase subunit
MAEKRVQLHFPLERIAEPVVTHLVTDYDLDPNLLRADVDAASGGWMIVGLTGPAPRVESALDWLRGQGLVVTEIAEG